MVQDTVKGVHVVSRGHPAQSETLTPQVLEFLASLHRSFEKTRQELLQKRVERQKAIDNGERPDFLKETEHIRNDDTWRGPEPTPALQNRSVEITGPPSRKMLINGLNAGAKTYMADFEDSNCPTWSNCLEGQVNLRDAINGTISFEGDNGKQYKLRDDGLVSVLLVRPRGWHMVEKHVEVDGAPISASIFDFGVYFFHNAKALLARGWGPYFYLPKMESHLEARLWNDIFNAAQSYVSLPCGTIRATVLIETILAAFEMDEIIYELRDHSAGLNCGRWDYIFSMIKKFRLHKEFVLPDRSDVSMTVPFMNAYVELLIKTCHRRGVHAMGGMSAHIPVKDNKEANDAAMESVRKDKQREVEAGHDGTWVAHPGLVSLALDIFEHGLKGKPNQLQVSRNGVNITAQDLLNVNFAGKITDKGIRSNIDVCLRYMESWLRGIGCVPIHGLMEDAATAEISRSQLWQWAKHEPVTAEGTKITGSYLQSVLKEEIENIKEKMGDKYASTKYEAAKAAMWDQITGEDNYADFLTTLLYDDVVAADMSVH